MENFRDQREIAYWQRCISARRYYLGYYGWMPAIITTIGAVADLLISPSLIKIIVLIAALIGFFSLWLQRPDKDESTKLLESMGRKSLSIFEAFWFPLKLKVRWFIQKGEHREEK